MFLAPADKAANNVVVVWRLHYINILIQELGSIQTYERISTDERESRQFIDKTTHRHSVWRQFTDTIEDNSSTLFEDNSLTHLFEGNWQL